MQNIPGDAGENPESKTAEEKEPQTKLLALDVARHTLSADDVDKLAAYIGGFLLTIAGVVQLDGHDTLSLWIFYAAVLSGVVAGFAFWRERFMPETTRFPIMRCIFTALFLLLPFGYIHRNLNVKLHLASQTAKGEEEYKAGIQSQFESLARRVDELQPRRLTEKQRKAIKEAISPYEGQKIWAIHLFTDSEAGNYAAEFAAIFRDARWAFQGGRGGSVPSDTKNVVVFVSEELSDEKVADAANALAKVLRELELAHAVSTIYPTKVLKPDEIGLGIAHKQAAD